MRLLFGPVLAIPYFLTLLPTLARESWEDDFKRYPGPVVLTAPRGYRTHAGPVSGSASTGTVDGPAKVEVGGWVDAGGERFYVTEATLRNQFKEGGQLIWISTGGTEQLPALPGLLKRTVGEDPDSGEEVTIDLYEETVTLQTETRWPFARTTTDAPRKSFPAAVVAVGDLGEGGSYVDFQLFANGDGNTSGYPLAQPSYTEITSGAMNPLVRLVSRPGQGVVRLLLPAGFTHPALFSPGVVFLAGFDEGKLARLSLGADAWSELAAISLFGAPAFRRGEGLEFAFLINLLAGGEKILKIRPDLVAGADYTKYELIEKMGAPFDDYQTPEYQVGWTMHLGSDLKATLLAPLYDGRGAPGMIELEGLSLDAVPVGLSKAIFTSEDFAAFRGSYPGKLPMEELGEGWTSILEGKLGEIPAAQRGPEVEPESF